MSFRRVPLFALFAIATSALALTNAPVAHAQEEKAPPAPPPAVVMPMQLSLDEALSIFKQRGLDLLIAEANVSSAQADVQMAGYAPNPSVNGGAGKTFTWDKDCKGCSTIPWTIGIADGGALFDGLSGKRGLRLGVAKKALEIAKLAKVDAARQLEFQVKTAYLQVAFARAAVDFSREIQKSTTETYTVGTAKKDKTIHDGEFARIETAKLEADQQVDVALSNLRLAQLGLAYLLGVRSTVPDFQVDTSLMKGSSVPKALALTDEESMLKLAMEHRPDYLQSNVLKEHAQAEIDLAKRLTFPDLILSLQYSQTGYGNDSISPPTLMFGVTITLPVFYSYGGELKKGEADLAIQSLQQTKIQAIIVADVGNAFASWSTARKLVERMETKLLASAKTARDITKYRYEQGQDELTDFLDAQRVYIAVNVEYLQDLTSFWTAIYQLEQAVGMELRK